MPPIEIRIQTQFVDRGIAAAQRALNDLTAAQERAARAAPQVGAAATQAERALLRYAQQLARTQVAMGDTAGAARTLEQALARVNPASGPALAATRQLHQISTGATGSIQRLAGSVSTLNTALGTVGLGVGAAQLLAFGQAAIESANTLERQQVMLRALAGSQQRYAEALAVAQANQRLFGGSMVSNLEPMRQFVLIANRTGVALGQLNTVAQQLATVNPAEGLEGAAFALSEFLSGDITSLAERFNLSRQALNALKNEQVDAATKLAKLSQMLAEQGVALDAVQARANSTAATYDRLGAALLNARDAGGGFLARFLEPAAAGLTNLLTGSEGATAALARLQANLQTTTGEAIAQAGAMFGLAPALQLVQGITAVLGVTQDDLSAATQTQSQSALMAAQSNQVHAQSASAAAAASLAVAEAIAYHTDTLIREADAAQQASATLTVYRANLEQDAAQALLTAARTEELEIRKQALEAQARAAAEALLASGAAGAAAAARLAASSSLVDQLTAAYYRLMVAQGAAGQASANAQLRADSLAREYGRMTGGEAAAFVRRQEEIRQRTDRVNAALRDQQYTLATTAGKAAILRQELSQLAPGTEAYIRKQTELLQLEQRAGGGGGGGGRRGGGARVRSATETAERLQQIQRDSHAALEEEEERHAQRVLEIQEDFQRRLAAQLQRNEVSKRASRADFYDALTKATEDVGPEIAKDLSAAYEEAFAKAQQMAQEGNAKLAEEYLKLKQDQIEAELEYQRQRARAAEEGDDAEVQRLDAIMQLRRDAMREEEQQLLAGGDDLVRARDQALQEEQQRHAAAQDQIAAKAAETAQKVEGAAQQQTAAVVSGLQEQARAADAWAGAVSDAADQVIADARTAAEAIRAIPAPATGRGTAAGAPETVGGGGGGGATASRSGAPAGAQLRAAAAPGPARRSAAAAAAGPVAAANVGQIGAVLDETAEILRFVSEKAKVINQVPINRALIEGYAETVGHVRSVLESTTELRKALATPQPPLDMAVVQQLAAEVQAVLRMLSTQLVPQTEAQVEQWDHYQQAAESAIAILRATQELRADLGEPAPPITEAYLASLAGEVVVVARTIQTVLVPVSEAGLIGLDRYADAVDAAIGILRSLQEARAALADPQPPISAAYVTRLAQDVHAAARAVLSILNPPAESAVDGLQRYADAVDAALGILRSLQEARAALADPQPPINAAYIMRLAQDVHAVARAVLSILNPPAQAAVDGLQRYADAVDAAIGVLRSLQEAREALTTPQPPIDPAYVLRLAQDATRIMRIVQTALIPVADETATGMQRYSDAVQAAVSAIRAPLDLTSDLFVDYVSPSDAQIDRLVQDAHRIVDRILQAAMVYDQDGLEAGRALAEGIGATFGALKDGLLFFDALRSGDFALDPAALQLFEQASTETLAVTRRLAAQAATIPAADLASLQAATAALSAQAEALIRLAAVPFADLPTIAGAFGASGGALGMRGSGGTSVVIQPGAIVIQGAGQSAQQIAEQVLRTLQARVAGRR